nr:PREDICTED: nuclear envelope integral membrane protein 2 [Latimeria chalumnae]|eukprot:XP_005996612.1 PREDICTED: nuclear envelope integral membrane protein 2 [Latimeria chalumnae]
MAVLSSCNRLFLLFCLPPVLTATKREEDAALEECVALKENTVTTENESRCFCYKSYEAVQVKYVWSTVQVKINSTGEFQILYQKEENCNDPETFADFVQCIVQEFIQFATAYNETTIAVNVNDVTCFQVEPVKLDTKYTVSVGKKLIDAKLVALFFGGVFLFFAAGIISRSVVFYYFAGVSLGILCFAVFLLLILKKFIPKTSTFLLLMCGGWSCSVFFIHYVRENINRILSDYKNYAFGYLLIWGFFSFICCYKHGPLTHDRSINLLTWTLQLIALFLMYCGLTIPHSTYAVIAIAVCSHGFRYGRNLMLYIYRRVKKCFMYKKPAIKLLTEDEYREQTETVTAKALEELRKHCAESCFSTWETVCRLQSPKRFAEFILGSSHLKLEEVSEHEEQYGIGGLFLEEQLFASERDGEPQQEEELLSSEHEEQFEAQE